MPLFEIVDVNFPTAAAIVWSEAEARRLGLLLQRVRILSDIAREDVARVCASLPITLERLAVIEDHGGGRGIDPVEFVRLCEVYDCDPEEFMHVFSRTMVTAARRERILFTSLESINNADAVLSHWRRFLSPPWLGGQGTAPGTSPGTPDEGAGETPATNQKRLASFVTF